MSKFYVLVTPHGEVPAAQLFEKHLASQGRRITQPRRILIERILSHHQPFDADALIDELSAPSRGSDRISRPTVYRTLNELVEAGLLRKMEND